MADEDDPIVASYDVCFNSSDAADAREGPKLYLLQYPAHRPHTKPYNAARSQAPTSLRLKPEAGFLEVEIPILTHENYNDLNGERFGKAMADSRTLQAGGSYGLAGGFGAGSAPARLRDIPAHECIQVPAPLLTTQTLSGKIPKSSAREPIYVLGCLHKGKIQLSHLDAVVQMRPQLHHIDAEDESKQKRLQGGTNAGASRQKEGTEAQPPKIESKAIEIKIKDNKDDGKARMMNDGATHLRDIQMDQWQNHEWVDEDEDEARTALNAYMRGSSGLDTLMPILWSSLSNGDWLDRMSAPREDGKKGLLAKLRGRERERARRKKAEEEKRQRQREAVGHSTGTNGPLLDMSEDSELSSPDVTDDDLPEEIVAPAKKLAPDVQVKEEPAPFPTSKRSLLTSPPTPKKRGRPRKNPAPK